MSATAQRGQQTRCVCCSKDVTWKTKHRHENSTPGHNLWRCHDCWRKHLGRELPEEHITDKRMNRLLNWGVYEEDPRANA